MPKGDGGGVGNERGSAHRRGFAVVLAATGLVGRGLTLPSGEEFVPARLEFETDQPTDDLTCISTTGRRIFFSAKRKTGDDDTSLGKTATQWVAQARSGQPDDVLGLATAQFSTTVEHIRLALKRHHQQPGTTGSVDEQKALTALTKRIKAAAPGEPELQKRVLDAAYVLEVKAVDAEDEDFHVAADRLENAIVPVGQGLAAARALSSAFHDQASQKSGSGVADWVKILRDAGLTVYADGNGPAGAAENARQLALRDHAARLGEQHGQVDLALLTDDVATLRVDELADGLRVVVTDPGSQRPLHEKLLVIARRWPRMLLTGLPGIGKSTALRQLAARWASDTAAPTPLLVRLPTVAAQCQHHSELTLSRLCEAAAATAPAEQRTLLAAGLQRACEHGHAVLLLDAFDECGDKRALVADGLAAVLASLPPQTGAILATRDSGLPAARRLELPAALLTTPRNLDAILRQLLTHVAAARQVRPEQRQAWIAQRRGWLTDARRTHDGLATVPLFAVLMTLAMTHADRAPSVQGQATLLYEAVEQSVHRWELRRPDVVATADAAQQLLDGFAVLGGLLTTAGSASRAEAEHHLAAMLAQRWDMRAAGPASVLTAQILRFWDEHLGVFVADGDARIEPRNRVFAEIGAAMAARWLTGAELAAWVAAAVTEPDRRAALLLAGELHPPVLDALLADAGHAPVQRALAAAAIAANGAAADDGQHSRLLHLLGRAAAHPEDPAEHLHPDDAWDFSPVAALAGLRLPAGLRDQRRVAVAELCDTDEERLVTAALSALADAHADTQPLNPAQAQAVRKALTDAGTTRKGIGYLRLGQPPGLLRVAGEAIDHLEVLGADLVTQICQVARGATLGAYADIEEALTIRGYPPAPAIPIRLGDTLADHVAALEDDRQVLPILHAARDMAANHGPCPASERWRLPHLCALFDLINPRDSSLTGFFDAIEPDADAIRAGWLSAAAAAAGLDLSAVAAQANAAALEHARSEQPTVWDLLSAPAPTGSPAVQAHRLTGRDLDVLIDALTTKSEWIAQSACELLHDVTAQQIGDRLDGLLDRLPDDRRQMVTDLISRITSTATQPPAPSDPNLSGDEQ